MRYHPFFITALATCISFNAMAQRTTLSLNDNWQYADGNALNSTESTWTQINLPHSWNSDSYVDKDYRRGDGTYKHRFVVPSDWENDPVYIRFEGANKQAKVYVNGQEVSWHKGGYVPFSIDITPWIKYGEENDLLVIVNNSDDITPPISADFTFFGGIYRDVWLSKLPQQHFGLNDDLNSAAIKITPMEVSGGAPYLNIAGEVKNTVSKDIKLQIVANVFAPDGDLVSSLTQPINLKGDQSTAFSFNTKKLEKPQLWSPESPNLYRVELLLENKKTGNLIDKIEFPTAFRWVSVDPDKGFYLNGEPYKLRGICRHQDQAPIGYALSDEMHRRDMQLAKDMGANFIRISHYPQDDAILEMCDKLGLLVWEEIPVIDKLPENDEYGDNAVTNVREMVRAHYNHPSVVMWGYMNEIMLLIERETQDREVWKAVAERVKTLANRLEDAVREEDSSRLTTIAFHCGDLYNFLGFNGITDITGWNLYQGWYGANMNGFDEFVEWQHRVNPERPIIISEYGAGSDKRIQSTNPQRFDFSTQYQQKYIEHYVPVIENTPYILGASYWNFIDFGSAPRDESMPRINNKGLVYSDRTPKDVYYYFKSYWHQPESPILHIATRDWPVRTIIGETSTPVKIYTNQPDVELFIDGKSLGKKKVENYNVIFDVPVTKGIHALTAKANNVNDATSIEFKIIPERLNKTFLEKGDLAINVGSNCSYISPESNLAWIADQEYKEGQWGYVGGKSKSTTAQMHLTSDNPLFQTWIEDMEEYRFDVPEGIYEIQLSLGNPYKASKATAYQLGQNSNEEEAENALTILINGKTRDTDLMLEPFKAYNKKYIVEVKDGEPLNVKLSTSNGHTYLNAIKIHKH